MLVAGRIAGLWLGLPRVCSRSFYLQGVAGPFAPPDSPRPRTAEALEAARGAVARDWGIDLGGPMDLERNAGDVNVFHSTPEIAGFEPPDDSWRMVGPLLADEVGVEPALDHDDGRPLVYVAFGTLFGGRREAFAAVLDALADEDVRVLVGAGGLRPDELAPVPANATVVGFANARAVLRDAAVFVTHGGTASVHEALAAGVPMVCLPLGADHWQWSRRVCDLGAGEMLGAIAPEGFDARCCGCSRTPTCASGRRRLASACGPTTATAWRSTRSRGCSSVSSGEPARGGVFVLGMHSSGTSRAHPRGRPARRTGGAAQAAQPDAHQPGRLLGAEPAREVQRPAAAFDGRLLDRAAAAGSPCRRRPGHEGVGDGGAGRVRRGAPRPALGVEGPRNCLTLSFWRAVLGDPAAVVVAFREPQEVVASFGRRKVVSPDAALALWERHLRAAVLLSEGLPSLVVDYALLVADPDATVRCIGGFLAAQGLTDTPVDPGAAARSVVPELHRVRGASDAPRLSVEQRRLADALRDAAARGAGTETLELGVETPSTEYLLTEERRRLQARTAG